MIQLSPDEIYLAASHGLLRRRAKLRGETRDRAQRSASTWDNEIEGACAELAFCKFRQIYWTGSEGIRARDGGDVDVRWTKHLNTGGLILYDKDDPNLVIVLMEGFAPEYRLVGWLRAGEGKRQEWKDRAGYYLVPRQHLRSL